MTLEQFPVILLLKVLTNCKIFFLLQLTLISENLVLLLYKLVLPILCNASPATNPEHVLKMLLYNLMQNFTPVCNMLYSNEYQ